ncbi:unnamed protein product [Tenebrio molitor]|nr:unnamed protein product [Tenebrio molitor]
MSPQMLQTISDLYIILAGTTGFKEDTLCTLMMDSYVVRNAPLFRSFII